MTTKKILIFCDGTGMDGNLASMKAQAQVPIDHSAESTEGQNATNVLRLSRGVKRVTGDNREQLVFYQSGVGSEANYKGDPVLGDDILQALGTAVASKIRDAYAFIAQNYSDGDEISIFGFSRSLQFIHLRRLVTDTGTHIQTRGAYTARKLAGLIDIIGLLQTETLGLFFQIWRQLVDDLPPTIPPDSRKVRIKCVGVWDTVGSVFGTIDALSIKDTSLPGNVDYALHAMSLQENRKMFLPTLWSVPVQGLAPGQVLKQVWFPGAHSDVGGGYLRHDLADLALFWMAGEIESFIDLDLDFIQNSRQKKPDPWGTAQPNNAFEDLPSFQQSIIRQETRLESNQITSNAYFHQSILVAPTKLTKPEYMVTLPILQTAFGRNWKPITPSLNSFEEKCKDEWSMMPIRGTFGLPFESIGDLFTSKPTSKV